MKKICIALLFLASCTQSKKELLLSPSNIHLGVVHAGDTMGFKIRFRNTSKKDTISVLGISSNCSCAMVSSDSFQIPPLTTKEVSGVYIGKREDTGSTSQRIAIHSDTDSAFQFVTIRAQVK